jgi:hydrogenase expression/formation protein HypC
MCLGVPGRVLRIWEADGTRMAEIDFGNSRRDVSLEFVSDLEVGEYTIVHIGFALQRIDEAEAIHTLGLFQQMVDIHGEMADPFAPPPSFEEAFPSTRSQKRAGEPVTPRRVQ